MSQVVIGIDPGLTGALAVVVDGELAWVADTPIAVDNRREYFLYLMAGHVANAVRLAPPNVAGSNVKAIVEDAWARPCEGVSSSFRSGRGLGIWEGILAGRGVEYERVAPTKWKRAVGLTGGNKTDARKLAAKLFPGKAELFIRVKDHGRAEAALLAWYGAKLEVRQ